jgi:hypothetical protein
MIPLLTEIYQSKWKPITPGRWREELFEALKWLPPILSIIAGMWLSISTSVPRAGSGKRREPPGDIDQVGPRARSSWNLSAITGMNSNGT